jgi:hypothetical protein
MITQKRILLSIVLIIAHAGGAFALSEMDIRNNWAKSIISANKGECKDESDSVHEYLDLAATLIIHGEYEDVREELRKAGGKAVADACKKAIMTNETPPK